MMPVPATLTSYLPVLLVSVTNHAVPDDTSFQTQAEGQVDYLSHEWREEDVWRSWRNMTRQKNAIANGMRLENASWRTWWKQRNKLKTISPETLNWLKDSDVTWLYGPLHIGSDWSKTAHREPPPSPIVRRQSSVDSSTGSRAATPSGKKPILKRRSISQLLSLPASPFFLQDGSDEEDGDDASHGEDELEQRPPLMHTKSDTHISWRSRPFRKESPPRIIAHELPPAQSDTSGVATSSNTSNSTGSSQDLSVASGSGAESSGQSKKKHISFNTFVEQYIAIEKPKRKYSGAVYYTDSVYDGGFDEDSEGVGDDDQSDQPSSFYITDRSDIHSDSDEDDEDEVLEMRSRRSRSSSSSRSDHAPAMRKTSPPSAQSGRRPPLTRQGSVDREHMTIAPIAPTILKSTGVGNNLANNGEDKTMRSQKEVELVYLPPSNSIYSLPGTPSIFNEDVYHHRESYFTVGTNHPPHQSPPVAYATSQSRSADSSPVLGVGNLPSPYPQRQSSQGNLQHFFHHQAMYESPMPHEDMREDTYDYFGVPDLGEDYTLPRRTHSRSRRSPSDRMDDPGGRSPRFAATGTPMNPSPRIVVNEVAGATEEREELSTASSGSPPEIARDVPLPPHKVDGRVDDIPLAVSFIHNGPTVPVSVPRIATHGNSAPNSPPDPGFLSPTEAGLVNRRRSPGYSPTSGSTTTGSYSLSSDSRSESRGRSSTRNSSSERDRSGSRSSRGTNSPLGSISPTGSAVGIVGSYGSLGVRGRDGRTIVVARPHRRGSGDEERGRDRVGRRIGDSLSPPSVIGSPSRSVSDDFPAYSPVLEKTVLASHPRAPSISGSSVSGSSTASGATARPDDGSASVVEEGSSRGRSVSSISQKAPLFVIPAPIPEEEETRSRQPTPANSPVRAFSVSTAPAPAPASPSASSHPAATSPLHVSPPPKSRPSEPVTSPSEAQATPASPTSGSSRTVRSPERPGKTAVDSHEHPQTGLVGRAAEIVSQARGFLGAIWNAV